MEPRTEAESAASLPGYVKEAWSQALVTVNDAGDEVQKILGRVAGWVELGPDEARRLGAELAERLGRERDELEASVESAVRRAVAPFRLPSRDEVLAIEARIAAIEARLDKLTPARRARR